MPSDPLPPPPNPVTMQGIGAAISEVLRVQSAEAKRLESRFDKVDVSLRELRLEQLHVDVRLDRVETRLGAIEERVADVERRPRFTESGTDIERTTPVKGHPGKYLVKPTPMPLTIASKVVLASIPPPGVADENGRYHLGQQLTDSGLHVKTPVAEFQRLTAENRAAEQLAHEFAKLSDERDAALALARQNWVKAALGSTLKTLITILVVGFLGLLFGALLQQYMTMHHAAAVAR